MKRITTVLLAGGKGARLAPLTEHHAKPAVPFGGCYRIIDFTLSNCVNSGLRNVFVLTQFKSMSLDRHINQTWRNMVNWQLGEFIEVAPAQQRLGEHWYLGNADAVYQNIYAIENTNPDYVVVLAGDHIYKMDYREMIDAHIDRAAEITVAGLPVSIDRAARQFGVMQIDSRSRIIGFDEKPDHPKPLPDDSECCLASMGIYVFSAKFLFDQLCHDALNEDTRHDFGRDIIPGCIHDYHVSAFVFKDRVTGKAAYWRDVGTLDSLYDANMDLLEADSPLNIYDESWPIWRATRSLAPPRILSKAGPSNNGTAGSGNLPVCSVGSLISHGSNVEGQVTRSVLGPKCVVAQGASVIDSVLFEGVVVKEGAQVRNAIITEGIVIPAGFRIGYDTNEDANLGATVTENGRVVVSETIQCRPFVSC